MICDEKRLKPQLLKIFALEAMHNILSIRPGRAEYLTCTDTEALDAFQLCTKLEGIIPALEPAHALARVGEVAQQMGKDGLIIMNLCGRGDKDVFSVAEKLGVVI